MVALELCRSDSCTCLCEFVYSAVSMMPPGDLGEFGKKTNFERATRTPFIIRDPAAAKRPPSITTQIVEFVDLMPTLIDLAGLQVCHSCIVVAAFTQ